MILVLHYIKIIFLIFLGQRLESSRKVLFDFFIFKFFFGHGDIYCCVIYYTYDIKLRTSKFIMKNDAQKANG